MPPRKKREKTCPGCGELFTPVHEKQLKCKTCIQKQNELIKAKAEGRTKSCKVCGNDFIPGSATAKYCSDKCRKEAINKRLQDTKSTNREPVKVKCVNPDCPNGGYFETTWQKYKSGAKYCSRECFLAVKKTKYKGMKYKEEPSHNSNQPEKVQQIVEIDYEPHPAQIKFHNSDARFKVLVCGIRFGKDRACIQEFIKKFIEMLSEDRPSTLVPRVHGWLVAPIFPLARQMWMEIKEFFPKEWVVKKNESELRIETILGGLIEIKSASDPDSLVSTGIDICILSEFSRVAKKEEVWGYIRGRVSSPHRGPGGKGGVVLINSTPKGRDLFYDMYQWGQSPDWPDWESWQFPSSANPHMDLADIEAAKRTLPDRLFRQEYLAEFLSDSGDVFLNIDEISTGTIKEPENGVAYLAAWDPAEKGDFSCFTIINSHGEQVFLKRWTGVPYTTQMKSIEYYCKKYNFASLAIDCTAAGSTTLVQSMQQRGINAYEIFFSSPVKAQLVSHFAVLCENKEIVLLGKEESDDARAQLHELKSYTYTYTETGKIKYHHPPGQHDDCVDALLMAYKDYCSPIESLPYLGLLVGASRWKTA